MKQFLLSALIVASPLLAFSKSVYLNYLRTAFPDSSLTLRCTNCHNTGPQLNKFGKDFADLKRELGSPTSEELWFRLSNMDSDQDGMNNKDEINANRNPGKEDVEPQP
ncbi:MAG: hypothetical protein AB7O96_11150 [Pseudobdellovibrionaceae bacterium]